MHDTFDQRAITIDLSGVLQEIATAGGKVQVNDYEVSVNQGNPAMRLKKLSPDKNAIALSWFGIGSGIILIVVMLFMVGEASGGLWFFIGLGVVLGLFGYRSLYKAQRIKTTVIINEKEVIIRKANRREEHYPIDKISHFEALTTVIRNSQGSGATRPEHNILVHFKSKWKGKQVVLELHATESNEALDTFRPTPIDRPTFEMVLLERLFHFVLKG